MKQIFNKLEELLFFSQTNKMIKEGRLRPVEASDALPLPKELEPNHHVFDTTKLNLGSGLGLIKSIFIESKKESIRGSLFYFVSQMVSLLTPVLIHQFIQRLESGNADTPTLVVLATLIAFTGYFSGLMLQHYFYRALKLQQKIVSILNFRIFQTSLGLSAKSREEINSGDVVNLMSSDTESVSDTVFTTSQFAVNTFLIFSTIGMLFYYFGISTIAAVVTILLLAPMSKKIAGKFNHCDEEIMRLRDKRITLMGQILTAIRLIKYFAWEKSIEAEVKITRDKEVAARVALVRTETLSGMIYMSSTTLVLLATLSAHAYRGETVTLALIFAGLSLFSLLEEPLGDMTNLLARWVNAKVSADRLVAFLKKEQNFVPRKHIFSAPSIVFKNFRFSFQPEDKSIKPVLNNISFKLEAGKKLAIIGPVGAGKTTLLNSILRELTPSAGSVWINGDSKYLPVETVLVPQESYIINGTLEENILFGTHFESESEKNEVIQLALVASCLDEDIKKFQMGLYTEIGERGINLSGGQKQRLSLARAYVKQPHLVLLDDPLSAVDHKTESMLMKHLILGEWKDKTVVAVTHRLAHLESFDQIVFLEHGEVVFSGHFKQLMKNPRFQKFYRSELIQSEVSLEKNQVAAEIVSASESGPLRITEEEERERGKIGKHLFFSYLSLLGGRGSYAKYILISLFASALISKIFPLVQKAWLSFGREYSGEDVVLFLAGYAGLGLVTLLGYYYNNILWYKRGIGAAVETHETMLRSVLRAPIRFFDSTPVGRLLQRFSRDMDSVDSHLMFSHIAAIDCFVQIFVSTILIVFVMPITVLFIGPIIGFYYVIQRAYRETAREIKRLDSIARSPRYAHFKETLQGLLSIRSYNQQAWFMNGFYDRLAYSHKMFHSHYMVNRWFSVRVPLIGGLIVLSSSLSVVWAVQNKMMTAASAGLVLVYAMAFWRYLNWGVRVLSDIEARMTSVERLNSLCVLKPEETLSDDVAGQGAEKKVSVPLQIAHGGLEFRNVSVRYASHLPVVLKDISFEIKSGERVGVIGRTGSGKSTIFQTLYRFVEVEQGQILLGGVPIAQLPLEQLRKSIAIIPQDPTLFMGTLRSNLDRFGEYSDEAIWAVLKKTHLDKFIENLPNNLEALVSENGHNFSQGQRQLICLARALLVKAKLVVLDEATASVDVETDRLVQKILRESLVGITQLIIAHRLETISDADNIIHLDNGMLVEDANHEEAGV